MNNFMINIFPLNVDFVKDIVLNTVLYLNFKESIDIGQRIWSSFN